MLKFDTTVADLLEHKDVIGQHTRTAQALRGLFSQHGFADPTYAYHELRNPLNGRSLESKFGVRETLSKHGLRVCVRTTVLHGDTSDTRGACRWDYELHVVHSGAACLDSVSHELCRMAAGEAPACSGWLEADRPVDTLLAHLRTHGYFADRGKQMGDFIRLTLASTSP